MSKCDSSSRVTFEPVSRVMMTFGRENPSLAPFSPFIISVSRELRFASSTIRAAHMSYPFFETDSVSISTIFDSRLVSYSREFKNSFLLCFVFLA